MKMRYAQSDYIAVFKRGNAQCYLKDKFNTHADSLNIIHYIYNITICHNICEKAC